MRDGGDGGVGVTLKVLFLNYMRNTEKMGMNVGWKFMTRQRFYRNRNLLGQRLLYYVNA